MSKRIVGLVVAVVGVVVLLLFATADVTKLGSGGDGFGTRQIIGVVGGAVVAVAGLVVAYAPWFPWPGE
jgi:hypothetical protein